MTLENFRLLVSSGRFVLLDFYAVWCGPCKAMHPVLDAVEAQLGATLDVVRIDIDNHQNHEVVDFFRIKAVPTLILYFEGRQLWRTSGVMSAETLVEELRRQERIAVY